MTRTPLHGDTRIMEPGADHTKRNANYQGDIKHDSQECSQAEIGSRSRQQKITKRPGEHSCSDRSDYAVAPPHYRERNSTIHPSFHAAAQ